MNTDKLKQRISDEQLKNLKSMFKIEDLKASIDTCERIISNQEKRLIRQAKEIRNLDMWNFVYVVVFLLVIIIIVLL